MTENLKIIVLEVNKLLKTDYNLITFDSLTPESILQLLIDVLHQYKAIVKFDVKENDPEKTNKDIIEALRKIQYRPTGEIRDDPSAYRRALLRGDKKIIYPIFQWIFENSDKAKKSAYLARFLLPLALPPEALAIPEIAMLWTQYLSTMDEFKETHKAHEISLKEGAQTREMKSDAGAIEAEIENVKKRIERTQARLDKVPQQELLLETANSLRIERDRQKELMLQIEEQKQSLNRASMIQERLKKELYNARIASQGSTPEHLMETIVEETQVLEFMIQQKLPLELQARQTEVQILQDLIDEPNINREYLMDLQNKVDAINKEVQLLVETRIKERGNQNDTLAPFRQQAAMVARNKETAAEQLDQATKELREVEQQIQQKSQKLKETVGDVILRGDDLKQFVNTLKAKSNVYKQQRAELATVKAEVIDLTQTLENLKSQDPSLQATLETPDEEIASSLDHQLVSRPDSPIEQRGIAELSRLVEGLVRAVNAARERITPLSQQLRPLRERNTDLKDERDVKKQTYDALNATLNSEIVTIQTEISECQKNIKSMEEKWQDLKLEYERAEILLEKAREELRSLSANSSKSNQRSSLKETLSSQIYEQESMSTKLQEQRQTLIATKFERSKQQELWTDLKYLFDVKIKCHQDSKMQDMGTLSITRNGAETLILQ